MEVGRLQHRTDPQGRLFELGVGADRRSERCPLLGLASPSSIRSVVVFPAPFGPRKPVIVPGSSANDSESTASTEPNRFVNESATTAGAEAAAVPAITGSDTATPRLRVGTANPGRLSVELTIARNDRGNGLRERALARS